MEGFVANYFKNVNVWYVRTATIQTGNKTEEQLDLENELKIEEVLRTFGTAVDKQKWRNIRAEMERERQRGRENVRKKANRFYVYDWKRWPAENSGSKGPELPQNLEKWNRGQVWIPQKIVPTFMLVEFTHFFQYCNERKSTNRTADEAARSYFDTSARAEDVSLLSTNFMNRHPQHFVPRKFGKSPAADTQMSSLFTGERNLQHSQ